MNQTNNNDNLVIVSISNVPWNYPYWTSRQFLMYELSKHVPVLFATDRTYIRQFAMISFWNEYLFNKPVPPFEPPKGLTLCKASHFFPKVFRYPAFDKYLAKKFGELMKRKCSKLSSGKVIAYLWAPHLFDCLSGLNPDKIIYHPYDKFDLQVNPDDRKAVLEAEQKILRVANAVITPHSRIAKSLDHQEIHIVHNGVFMPAFLNFKKHQLYDSIASIPKPRIGYIGIINSKVDFELIFNIAQSKPDWSIVLLGPVKTGIWQKKQRLREIKKLPNVSFLPAVPFNEIPVYMSHIDIGIMPYRLSTWAGYCESPLKLYQYWAAGLPVVSSPLPNISHQPGSLSVATETDEWIKAIQWEISHDSNKLKQRRRQIALENSWSRRANEVVKIIRNI